MIQHASDHEPPLQQVAGHKLRREVRQHYEMLLQRLPWPAGGASAAPRTIGLSSCRSGEGVSTVAAHLAIAAAALGDHPVLLVDANFARPCVPRIFGVRGRPGLAEVLEENCQLAEALQPSAVDNLSLLAAGRPAGSHGRVYGAAGVDGLIKELAGEFDLVVVDLPAAERSTAALQMASRLDGMLLVVESGRVPQETVRRVSDLMVRAGAHPLGAVLNKWQQDVPTWLSDRL